MIRTSISIPVLLGLTALPLSAMAATAKQCPPELAADIVDRGIILSGGGSLLKNLDKRLREETSLPVFITEDPLSSVVLGAGKILDNIDLLKQLGPSY